MQGLFETNKKIQELMTGVEFAIGQIQRCQPRDKNDMHRRIPTESGQRLIDKLVEISDILEECYQINLNSLGQAIGSYASIKKDHTENQQPLLICCNFIRNEVGELVSSFGVEAETLSPAPLDKLVRVDISLNDGVTLCGEMIESIFSFSEPFIVGIRQRGSIFHYLSDSKVVIFFIPNHSNNLNHKKLLDEFMKILSDKN